MTGDKTVSYTKDPTHWKTMPIQDDVSGSKEEASDSEKKGSSNKDDSVQDDVSGIKEEATVSEEKGSANEDNSD